MPASPAIIPEKNSHRTFFPAQTLRPDVIEAEADMVGTVLLSDDVLSRGRKEYILRVVSASNLNTYCVAVHCEMLRAPGVSGDESDQVAVDHHRADLSEADKALLDFVLKLAERPPEFAGADMDILRKHGFTEEQILESVVMTVTNFLNTLQIGLLIPDSKQAGGSLARERIAPTPVRLQAPISVVETRSSTRC